MCGIVGLFLKRQDLFSELGRMFAPMLAEMTDRGPDSAGVAIYSRPQETLTKITAFNPDPDFNWSSICDEIGLALDVELRPAPVDTHCVILTNGHVGAVAELLESCNDGMQVMSVGSAMEIYKETGLPDDVISRFGITERGGSHAVGHTRMATESGAGTTGFGARIGRIEPGRAADLVLMRWSRIASPFLDPDVGVLDAVVQRGKTDAVDTVLIGGVPVLRDGRRRPARLKPLMTQRTVIEVYTITYPMMKITTKVIYQSQGSQSPNFRQPIKR